MRVIVEGLPAFVQKVAKVVISSILKFSLGQLLTEKVYFIAYWPGRTNDEQTDMSRFLSFFATKNGSEILLWLLFKHKLVPLPPHNAALGDTIFDMAPLL